MEEENKMVDAGPEAASTERRRPRLNLGAALGGGERKRGKSMFGLALGTLNKAKIEEKERNASEAAKKRQMIEKRLQTKLRKETDSVRRAEEAKKEKSLANRKEEELQLKDSIFKLRRKRLPLLANFLCTLDEIPDEPSFTSSTPNPLSGHSRTHPPPLHFLPAILTPAQQAFLDRRKSEVNNAAEKEWNEFRKEREVGIQEIAQLRQKVSDEETRQKQERDAMDTDDGPVQDKADASPAPGDKPREASQSADMDVDDSTSKSLSSKPEKLDPEPSDKKDESETIQADDDDAVEY